MNQLDFKVILKIILQKLSENPYDRLVLENVWQFFDSIYYQQWNDLAIKRHNLDALLNMMTKSSFDSNVWLKHKKKQKIFLKMTRLS